MPDEPIRLTDDPDDPYDDYGDYMIGDNGVIIWYNQPTSNDYPQQVPVTQFDVDVDSDMAEFIHAMLGSSDLPPTYENIIGDGEEKPTIWAAFMGLHGTYTDAVEDFYDYIWEHRPTNLLPFEYINL